jgi:hypothetical protein
MKTIIKIEMEIAVDVANFYERNAEWRRGFQGSCAEFCEELGKFIDDHPFVIGCKVESKEEV